jgi:hypothetical protein
MVGGVAEPLLVRVTANALYLTSLFFNHDGPTLRDQEPSGLPPEAEDVSNRPLGQIDAVDLLGELPDQSDVDAIHTPILARIGQSIHQRASRLTCCGPKQLAFPGHP